MACRLGTELGLQLEEALAGGGSDGNFTSQYTATLDGLGAVGDGAHARHEHLRLGPTPDLWSEPFETSLLDRGEWATGDFVVGRVVGERNRLYECETKTGRMAELVRGDLLVGALGRRAATLEGVGDWRDTTEDLQLDALTSAGLLGRATQPST